MNLVRWNPFGEMSLLQNQMNRLFDTALQGWPGESNGTTSWIPAADIYESDDELVVNLDLPGVDPKTVDIRMESNVLSIRGERQFDEKLNKETFHRVERSYGPFARSFTLSTSVNPDRIRADFKAGVLRITLPKAESAKPKRIQIAATA
ncbi:MAG TPA: Hsp20/alpha crystallin family protein [Terriglobia bacterium]|nr:Hsp20/alpha crystallin family protein [Terriglobia bacterium]